MIEEVEREYGQLQFAPDDHPLILKVRKDYIKGSSKQVFGNRIRIQGCKQLWDELADISKELETQRPTLLRDWLNRYIEDPYELNYMEDYTPKGYIRSYLHINKDMYDSIQEVVKDLEVKEFKILNNVMMKHILEYRKGELVL